MYCQFGVTIKMCVTGKIRVRVKSRDIKVVMINQIENNI